MPHFEEELSDGTHQGAMNVTVQRLAYQVSQRLPGILKELLQAGHDPGRTLQLECNLTSTPQDLHAANGGLQVAAIDISNCFGWSSPSNTMPLDVLQLSPAAGSANSTTSSRAHLADHRYQERPSKRVRRHNGIETTRRPPSSTTALVQRPDVAAHQVPRRRTHDNLALQPSTFDKYVQGVWESIYSGVRIDPAEVIEQWQAIESNGQPRLLTEAGSEVSTRDSVELFSRMNILARRVSQTSKTFRSLEIIVQAHWVDCFDARVAEMSSAMTREKAKKAAMAEACSDFGWSEKELRNKTAIWRGYFDIKNAAGWVGLVFASTGLYRLVKYRASLPGEAFDKMRSLRHRFELAADTLHQNWRMLLGIVGEATERRYTGRPHDWVVNAGNEAIPLAPTYFQWDPKFSYKHIEDSVIDEEAWGHFDPRTVYSVTDPAATICEACNEHQSNETKHNACRCYPNLYGLTKVPPAPLQIFRTPNGKNNGLIACCPIEKGWAVGEFVGEITSGLAGLDVMIGETEQCTYQIWQGRQGNHIKFVNHSCTPNANFERFVWLGKHRIVLASLGIEAGDEVTVDYGDTYWHSLDKECKCGAVSCRYRDRRRLVEAPSREERQLGGCGENHEDIEDDDTEDGEDQQ